MLNVVKMAGFLLILLNPFLIIIYLTDVVEKLTLRRFSAVIIRAGVISLIVFYLFALLGYAIFSDVLHTQFASFQIFGGVVFLMIGIRFVFYGPETIEILRGESPHVTGAIAMPVMIGPGTISASVLIGQQLDKVDAFLACFIAVAITLAVMISLKHIHDYVKPRREELIQHYIEIVGRIAAIIIGTVSIDMIMRGVKGWFKTF